MTEEEKLAKVKQMQSDMAETVMEEAKNTMMILGHVPGVVIGFDAEARCVVSVPMGWKDIDERREVLAMIKALMILRRVVLYTVCHEAWAKSFTPEEFDKVKSHTWGDLGKEEVKDEVISVLVVSSRHVEARGCRILRKDGKVTKFEDLPKNAETSGDLTRLIPWSKIRDEKRPT